MNALREPLVITSLQQIGRLEAGRHAALTRKGIQWRSPEQLATLRLQALCRGADPAALRRYACEVAEVVLPLFQAAFAHDHRPLVALEVARRYAAGRATEADRLAASTLMLGLCRELDGDRALRIPYAAASASAFCLWKSTAEGFEHGVIPWVAQARGREWPYTTTYPQHFAALEAIQRA